MNKVTLSFFTLCLTLTAMALPYPGPEAGASKASKNHKKYILENNLLKAEWTLVGKHLSGAHVTNKSSAEVFASTGELFALARHEQVLDRQRQVLSIRKGADKLELLISNDGKSWETLTSFPLSEFPSPVKNLRVGKISSQGAAKDYAAAGELGSCEFQEVFVHRVNGELNNLTSKPTRIHKSARAETQLTINNERITIKSHANSASFAEYAIAKNWTQVSCKVKKSSDKGMSWGPGICLNFADGKFLLLNIRAKGQYSILSHLGEKLINREVKAALKCDLTAADFFLTSEVEVINQGKSSCLSAQLEHKKSGLRVDWNASLAEGDNYVKQQLSFASLKTITIHGLEFLQGCASNCRQVGKSAPCPVAR